MDAQPQVELASVATVTLTRLLFAWRTFYALLSLDCVDVERVEPPSQTLTPDVIKVELKRRNVLGYQ